MPLHDPMRPSFLHRLTAVGALALLFVLLAASASPVLHEWLHGDAPSRSDHSCAIVWFASGVTFASAAIVVVAAPRWREATWALLVTADVASPRYLRLPGRAPPAR